jgi:type I restriction enzyme M protein
MSNGIYDIVAKLWNLCNILKDDGVTYHEYVTELTFLLFLKMAKETGIESVIPEKDRWDSLSKINQADLLDEYRQTLLDLGRSPNRLVKEVFEGASTIIKVTKNLKTLMTEIDRLDWYSVDREHLGDLYEGLLQRNSEEKKSGAGQYFTPRPLIQSIVNVLKPGLEDVIQDPAAGTGGFLIAADAYIKQHSDPQTWTAAQQKKYRSNTFFGLEHVQSAHRLAVMNLMVHKVDIDLDSSGIGYGDTLGQKGADLSLASLMLSNPPFGTKKGAGLPSRDDFTYPTSNKQFCFLQHIYKGLVPGGRAGVVLPDNVLFEGNVGRQIRADLMDKCNLHTILRLPTGIFYAQGVKTNVLFFTRGKKEKGNTKEVWVYDLRANMPQYGKRTLLTNEHFKEFEVAFGGDPLGSAASLARRVDTGESGRFRKFTREFIRERGDNLDISWLKDDSATNANDLPDPTVLVNTAMGEIEAAMFELQGILAELNDVTQEAAI